MRVGKFCSSEFHYLDIQKWKNGIYFPKFLLFSTHISFDFIFIFWVVFMYLNTPWRLISVPLFGFYYIFVLQVSSLAYKIMETAITL
jgi:hypothetical protein